MSPVRAAVAPIGRVEGPSDAVLVARALEGDRWAQEALYRRHVHRVTSIAARLLRRSHEVEDVVQDTFIEALRDLGTLREAEHVGRWLARITVHKVHRRFRRRRLLRWLGLDRGEQDEALMDQAHPSASPEALSDLATLDVALDQLATEDRAAWVLRHLEGYQLTEVAELTSCSLATVKRRLARAEELIRSRFEEEVDHG